MEIDDPLPPWPAPGPSGSATSSQARNERDQPTERELAAWLLELGGEWHLCGRNLMERHLVRTTAELPEEVSALLGVKLPPADPRTDAILERLAACRATRGLAQLDLARTAVSPAGLRTVAQFAWLEGLDLSSTDLTLEDLAPLKGLPELTKVELAGTPMGHLDHADLFGQTAVPGALRHPVAAIQRTLARLVDLSLAAAALAVAWPAPWPDSLPEWAVLLLAPLPSALLLVPVEALFVAALSTTPGKSLLRVVVVRPEGPPPRPLAALLRAGLAGLTGWAAGLRPLSWVVGARWAVRIGKGNQPPWDRLAGTRCIARVCAGWRLLVAGSLIVGSWLFQRSLT